MKFPKKIAIALLFVCSQAGISQAVSVSDFFVFRNGKTVVLHWTLDSGATCNGIVILRATDTTNYMQIGDIPGICGSNTAPVSYTFTDQSPVLNQVNYYKLQFGLTQFSGSRSILVEYLEHDDVLILTDPANSSITFKFNNDAKESFSFALYNVNGREVFLRGGILDGEVSVDAAELPAGPYFYRLQNGHRKNTGKVVLGK